MISSHHLALKRKLFEVPESGIVDYLSVQRL